MMRKLRAGWRVTDFVDLHELTSARINALRAPKPNPNTLAALAALNALSEKATLNPQESITQEISEHRAYTQLARHPQFIQMKALLDVAVQKRKLRKEKNAKNKPAATDELIDLRFLNAVVVWTGCVLLAENEGNTSANAGARAKEKKVKMSELKEKMRKRTNALLGDLRAGGWRVLEFSQRTQLQELLTVLNQRLTEKRKRDYRGQKTAARSICKGFASSLLLDSVPRRTVVPILQEFCKMCELKIGERTVQRCAKEASEKAQKALNVKILASALAR